MKTGYFKIKGRVLFVYGFNIRRFGIGFSVSKWDLDINLGPFWITVEF